MTRIKVDGDVLPIRTVEESPCTLSDDKAQWIGVIPYANSISFVDDFVSGNGHKKFVCEGVGRLSRDTACTRSGGCINNPPQEYGGNINNPTQFGDKIEAEFRNLDPLAESISQELGLKRVAEFFGFVGLYFEASFGPSFECLHNTGQDLATEQEPSCEKNGRIRKVRMKHLEDILLDSSNKTKRGQPKRSTRAVTKKKALSPEDNSSSSVEILNDFQIINRNRVICGADGQATNERPSFSAKQIWEFLS
ncbi:hypothetical protein Ancab_004553 [Ancistrocladus abbreviatus]